VKNLSQRREEPSERQADQLVARIFENDGWNVQRMSAAPDRGADLVVRRRGVSYIVQVKAGPEGRADRLVPLWSQAWLEASALASSHGAAPLAIVVAPRIRPAVARQILDFAERYAPQAAAGVIGFDGLRRFRGEGLDGLDVDPPLLDGSSREAPAPSALFSDLNQWMLKVLLAPELPPDMLSAPREAYSNASQLAAAARVSVMSAYRFVQQLQMEGYLHESRAHLRLVRRRDLFQRWQAWSLRPPREMPMRLLLRGDVRKELGRILGSDQVCLALFAAADALGLGFVQGLPPHVYVPRLADARVAKWSRFCATIATPTSKRNMPKAGRSR